VTEIEIDKSSEHYVHSSLREMIIEHLFIGSILKSLWLKKQFGVEILKPQVDNAGYDLVLTCKYKNKVNASDNHTIIRYIQLKSTCSGGKRANVNVSIKLTQKPHWCVIWIFFNPDSFKFDSFFMYDAQSGSHSLEECGFKRTKHTKGDSLGEKKNRLDQRDIPKGRFEEFKTINQVIERLFSKSTK
jgi:hypothetical protein